MSFPHVACLILLSPWILSCRTAAPAEPVGAMQRVLAEDEALGGVRNHACETASLGDAIHAYVQGMEALDFGGCPEEFTTAFRRHIDAWRDSEAFFRRFDSLRGEMHDLFEEIRQRGGEVQAALEQQEAAIWGTWGEVEAAVTAHDPTGNGNGS